MPGFQRKYAIEINDDVMGQQGEDRHLAEKRRPGQREGEGTLAQLVTTFGRMYDRVIT